MRAKNLLLAQLTSWQEEAQVLPWVGQRVGAHSLFCVFFFWVCNRALLSLILYTQSEAFLMFGAEPQPPSCVRKVCSAVLDGSNCAACPRSMLFSAGRDSSGIKLQTKNQAHWQVWLLGH